MEKWKVQRADSHSLPKRRPAKPAGLLHCSVTITQTPLFDRRGAFAILRLPINRKLLAFNLINSDSLWVILHWNSHATLNSRAFLDTKTKEKIMEKRRRETLCCWTKSPSGRRLGSLCGMLLRSCTKSLCCDDYSLTMLQSVLYMYDIVAREKSMCPLWHCAHKNGQFRR